LRSLDGDAIAFAHGHLLRVLAARWIGLPAYDGGLLALDTAHLGVLGWEREQPVVRRWNVDADTDA
jgi:probable phosphoglycerate mutase